MSYKLPVEPWKRSFPTTWLLRNGQVIDVVSGQVAKKDILVEKGRFKEIADAGSSLQSDIAVDIEGAYVCPGLIDCHVHFSSVPGFTDISRLKDVTQAQSLLRQPALCGQVLSRGFTSVRDCGGATPALKEALREEVFPGPRLFMAGRALSQTGGHADLRGVHEEIDRCNCHQNMFGMVCDGVPACLAAARDNIRRGADFIKIMAGGGVVSPTDRITNLQFTAEEIRAVVTVAKQSGTYVTAHAYTPASIRHCIENGVRGIEHGNFINEETAKLMAENNVFLTPTLVTYHMLAELGETLLSKEMAKKNEIVLKDGLNALKVADEAGVTICHGSDLLGSLWAAQTREFSLRSEKLSSLKILQGATVNAARLVMAEGSIGQIREGFLADLLILKQNPLEDISILDRPESELQAVIKDGKLMNNKMDKLNVLRPENVGTA